MYYNGKKKKGNRTTRRTYRVLTSKNTITIVDLKIIGL